MTRVSAPSLRDIVSPLEIDDEEVRFYEKEGYLLIPGAISETDTQALRAEILEVVERVRPPHAKLQQTREYDAGGMIDALVHSPNLLGLAERLMGGPSTLHSIFTAVKATGGGRFHYHQDNQYTRFDGPGINLWVATQDVTPRNGCLRIVPRSHLDGTQEWVESGDGDEYRKVEWEPEYALPLRMRAGDLAAFNRLTVHGSGPNHLAEPRVGYGVQFHRNDTRGFVEGEWRLLVERPCFDLSPRKKT